MLWNASHIHDHVIVARDGKIGTIVDFLFDDRSWHIRWAVVDTGTWLSSRKVLLPTSILKHPDMVGREFPIDLTKQQVKNSPDVDSERPVSRQMEASVYNYYGWGPYWGDGLYEGAYGYTGGMGVSPFLQPRPDQQEIIEAQRQRDDPHLRSVEAISGYHIHAPDGEIGHVEDFLVEGADWSIHYLVVDTKNWWPGKKVLVSPGSVKGIDWNHSRIDISVARQIVKDSPAYDTSTMVDPSFENQFNGYYGGIGAGTHL
jgi:hypothetical protein